MGKNTWLVIVSIIVAAFLFVIAIAVIKGTSSETQKASKATATTQLQATVKALNLDSCSRGNIVRADRYLDTLQKDDSQAERERVRNLEPILNCPETFKAQRPIPLDTPETEKFILIVREIKIPVVRNGLVIGEKVPKFVAPLGITPGG